MKISSFNKGEIIFRQGDFADGMFDILSGSVGVYVNYGTEHETQLTTLGAGQFLGEMGLIEVYPRSATAVAMEDGTRLQEIGEAEFSDFFTNQPGRLLQIMRQLSKRLRERTEDYESACDVLENLKQTQDDPEKRSESLVEKAKRLIEFYDEAMKSYNGNYTEGFYYPFYVSMY